MKPSFSTFQEIFVKAAHGETSYWFDVLELLLIQIRNSGNQCGLQKISHLLLLLLEFPLVLWIVISNTFLLPSGPYLWPLDNPHRYGLSKPLHIPQKHFICFSMEYMLSIFLQILFLWNLFIFVDGGTCHYSYIFLCK